MIMHSMPTTMESPFPFSLCTFILHKIYLLDKIKQFTAISFFGKIKNRVKVFLKPLTKIGMTLTI